MLLLLLLSFPAWVELESLKCCSVRLSPCLFNFFGLNYSSIWLHTICSSYPSLGECFKTKVILACPIHFLPCPKNGPASQMTKCSLSMVESYTVRKQMERRFRKGQKIFDLPHPLPGRRPITIFSDQQSLVVSCASNSKDLMTEVEPSAISTFLVVCLFG